VGRRNRGEAIGRVKGLSGHIHCFYTGKPPKLLGGLHPLLVFIRPYASLGGEFAARLWNVISYPPRVYVKQKIAEIEKL